MAGVDLTLIGPGCNPCMRTTDGSGYYRFPGLSAANYSINVDQDTLTLSGSPSLTAPASLPHTVPVVGGNNPLDIGFDSLNLPGLACTTNNAFYYDFEGLSNSFLPTSSSSGPFSGSLSGAAGWSWEVETFLVNGSSATNGKIYTGTQSLGDNIPGDSRGKAITLHAAGWSQQWITLTLDLSALDLSAQELLLDFDYADHGEDSNPEDRVQVRGTSSDPWITVHTLHPDKFTNDTWIEVRDKNLLSYLASNGQTPGSTFQLRIGTLSQYMARIGTDLEGLTVDNVCLRTGTLPASGKLEGFIFKDIDGDGVRENTVEVSEVGFEGVELELNGPDCTPCSLTTDRGGWYRQENLTPGNYTLQITSVPGSPIQTKAGPTPIVIRPGDNLAPERGFLATQVFTENTVMMAKGYAEEDAPPAEIWWVDPTTGSTRRATQAQNIQNNGGGPASPTSQDEINSLAANVNSCQVYYGNGTKLYRWDVLEDQHYFISDLASQFPQSGCGALTQPQDNCFTGGYLDSAGATFWPATNTLYLASEGGPVGRFNISAIHEIVMTPDGTDIVSLRRLPVQEDAQAQIGVDDGIYPVGGFGDIVPFDNGGGGVLIAGSTHNNGYDLNGAWEGNPRYYFWTYDVAARDFTLIKQVNGRHKMFQLGNNPSGRIWAGRSYVIQEIDPATGNLLDAPLDVPSAAMIYDMTGFVGACMAQIGTAKRVSTPPVDNGNGTWTVEYTVEVETLGTMDLFDVQVRDQLAGAFGTYQAAVGQVDLPGEYTLTSAPALQNPTGGADLTANPAFNGSSDLNLLSLNAGDELPIGANVEIAFEVTFYPRVEQREFVNQAVALGDTSENGTTDGEADDLSDDGVVVDPNGNGYPEDPGEGDPTVFTIDVGFDLALTYQYLSDNSVDGQSADGRLRTGDKVTLRLTLYNQGTVPLTGSPQIRSFVDLTKFSGFDLADNPNGATGGALAMPYSWAVDGDGHGIVTLDASTPLPPGQNVTLDVTLTVATVNRGSHYAYAEMWTDGSADSDSTPESEQNNQNGDVFVPGVIDNTGGDEDDHDGAQFTLVGGRLGDRVWQDANRDGVQNGGEPGIGGVGLQLYLDDGNGILDTGVDTLVSTTTTDANGLYSFRDLDAANYFVRVNEATVPAGYAATTAIGPNSNLISMQVNDVDNTIDFGYAAAQSVIGDFIWYDNDSDGLQDTGELGIPGIQVTVTGPGGYNQVVLTDASGLWSAPGVTTSGSYTVSVDAASAGLVGPTNQSGNTILIDVVAGDDYLSADFGYLNAAPNSIGDLVFSDLDSDGVYDPGEPGIGGVSLSLFQDNGNNFFDGGDPVVASTTTAADGSYEFNGMEDGGYFVGVIDVAGVLAGLYQSYGVNPTAVIPVAGGSDYNDADFGYASPPGTGTIGNLVFFDADGNGRFHPTRESGMEFIELELWIDRNGNCTLEVGFDTLIRTTSTDSQGRYAFRNLATPQTYLVRIKPGQPELATFEETVGSIGVDEDSQPKPFCAQLTSGAARGGVHTRARNELRADFGLWGVPPYEISGTVFQDADADGIYDVGTEGVVSGATLTLYLDLDADGLIDATDPLFGTTTSDGSGDYAFGGLPTNTNWIIVSDVTGTVASGNTQTTQTATGGVERVLIQGLSQSNRNFGYGAAPTLALVSRFAALDEGGIVVEWETANEIGTLGFYLFRWLPAADDWEPVGEFVPSPNEALGAVYRVSDPYADSSSARLEYALIEVEASGGEIYHGPFTIDVGGSSAVPDGSLGATRHQRQGIHTSRDRAGIQDAARFRRPQFAGDGARLTVAGGGVYSVSSAAIAGALGMSDTGVNYWIAESRLRLTSQGEEIQWWSTDGRNVYFYVPPFSSIFDTAVDVFVEHSLEETATVGGQAIENVPAVSGSSYAATVRLEENNFGATSALHNPDQEMWFWKSVVTFPGYDTTVIPFDLPDHLATGDAQIRLAIFGGLESANTVDHRLDVWLNDQLLEVFEWDGDGRRELLIPLDNSDLYAVGNELRVQIYAPRGIGMDYVYIDFLEVEYQRRLAAPTGQLLFTANDVVSTVEDLPSSAVEVLDVTNPSRPVRLHGASVAGNRVTFASQIGREYFLFTPEAMGTPEVVGVGGPFPAMGGAEYLVITAESMASTAQRLADYRASQGLSVRTVVIEDVYDRYSAGEETPWAINAFLREVWTAYEVKPRFVTLVGKGSYDYRGHLGQTSLLPPALIGTAHGLFASDAVLGDLFGNGNVPDVAIGRIPAVTNQELDDYIDKVIAWESGSGAFGDRVLLAADNADKAGNFSASLDVLQSVASAASLATERFDIDLLGTTEARSRLLTGLNEGAFWLNYQGHGGLDRFAAEGLLTLLDVPLLQTTGQIPIVTALSCAVNRFEVPGYTSLGEALVLDADGGAIAVLAPTGLSQNNWATDLGEDILRAAFFGTVETLGEAVLEGMKDNATAPMDLRTYTLLGDPALRLPTGSSGPPVESIFSDGFESGDTSLWSDQR